MTIPALLEHWHGIVFLSFCLVALIQVFYYLFFFSRLIFYSPEKKSISQTHPVSVIICARDEAANLGKNLPGALVQQYPTTHEVIVVDDNSFDDTKYLLKEFQKRFKKLQVVELTQEAKLIPGKKYPLSVGIKTAKHEIVLLTDADCVPASEVWIQKMQDTYDDNTEIILGYGPLHKRKGLLNKVTRWETFHTALQYLNYALAGIPYMGVGRNLSYRKSLFFRHKGFSSHNHLPGGDDDLFISQAANKRNTKINIDHDTFALSEAPGTWSQWIRQKGRHYSTSKFYKLSHKILLGLYSFSHFTFYPLMILSLFFFDWRWVMAIFGFRLIIQAFIFYGTTKKLNERDLYGWFVLWDIWMFFYYLIFSVALVKKPRMSWK